jgi:hypothetical protein
MKRLAGAGNAAGLLAFRVTVVPAAGAGALKVAVNVAGCPLVMNNGLIVRLVSAGKSGGGVTVTVNDAEIEL